jgi:hypothetical protein
MWPLLPALILLLLQGPANVERMALDGRLPAALEALQARMPDQDVSARGQAVALASLLAVSGDPQLSHALFALLRIPPQVAATEQPKAVKPLEEPTGPPLVPKSLGSSQAGFLKLQRSRDGPAVR